MFSRVPFGRQCDVILSDANGKRSANLRPPPSIAGKNAFVTLATSDEYAIGGLVLAQSIRNAGTEADIVIMVTSGVSPALV